MTWTAFALLLALYLAYRYGRHRKEPEYGPPDALQAIGWLSAREGTSLAPELDRDARRLTCHCGTIFYTSTQRTLCIRCDRQAAEQPLAPVVRLSREAGS